MQIKEIESFVPLAEKCIPEAANGPVNAVFHQTLKIAVAKARVKIFARTHMKIVVELFSHSANIQLILIFVWIH